MLRLFSLFVAFFFALPAMAQDNPIGRRIAGFTEAYNAGDAATIAGFYTKDGALFPPQSDPAVGREAIRVMYASAFIVGVGNLRFKILEIRQHGPGAAVEIGETLFEVNGQDIRARYLHVWELVDGVWMISRDIYNVIGRARQ